MFAAGGACLTNLRKCKLHFPRSLLGEPPTLFRGEGWLDSPGNRWKHRSCLTPPKKKNKRSKWGIAGTSRKNLGASKGVAR